MLGEVQVHSVIHVNKLFNFGDLLYHLECLLTCLSKEILLGIYPFYWIYR